LGADGHEKIPPTPAAAFGHFESGFWYVSTEVESMPLLESNFAVAFELSLSATQQHVSTGILRSRDGAC
jgi:hypothetical protein